MEKEEDEEEESVLLFLFLCLSAGRLDLMGDKTTLWGEGTSLVKVEGGMTPTLRFSSSSRMFLALVARCPGLFLVVSEEILGSGIFSGFLNS